MKTQIQKRFYCLFILWTIVSLVGCTPAAKPTEGPQATEAQPTKGPPATEAQPSGGKTVIRYVQLDKRPSDVEGINAMEAAFEAKNPDIDIQIEYSSWDDGREKYIIQAQAGNPPDVAQIAWGWVGEFAALGMAVNLDSYMADYEYLDDIIPIAEKAAKVEGSWYGMPWFAGMDMLYYNMDIFAEAGITKPPETWDELLEMASKLTKVPDRYAFGWAAAGDAGSYMTLNLARQFGGEWVDTDGNYKVNTEPWIKAFKLQQEFILNRKDVSPPTTITDDYVTRAENFEKGYTVMYYAGSWDLKLFEDMWDKAGHQTVGISPLPYPTCDGCKPAAFGDGNHWIIFEGSKNKEASWKWLAFMASPEGQSIWTKYTIFFPINKTVIASDTVQKDPYLSIVADAIDSAWVPEPTPELIDWAFNYGRAILQDALLGNLTAEQAAAKMQEELDAHKAER